MKWNSKFLPETEKDLNKLDGNEALLVSKAITKVLTNPISIYDGGYGKPLGNKNKINLTGFFKIKLACFY